MFHVCRQITSQKVVLTVILVAVSISQLGRSLAAPTASAAPQANDKRSQAIAAYNAKDYRGAAQLLDDYVSVNSRDPYAAYYAALANQQLGNGNKARIFYRQVFMLSPGSQVGGYARNMLIKLDPSFASEPAKLQAAKPATSQSSPAGTSKSNTETSSDDGVPPLDPSLPAECRIPFEQSRNGIMLDCYVEGRPIKMSFDTGAPQVVAGKNQLQPLGIPMPTGRPMGMTGGSSSADQMPFWIVNATVKVGPIERRNMPVMVLEFDHAEPLLGQTFFKNYDCNIDSKAGQLNFRQKALSAKQSLSGATISVPFVFKEAGNRVMVDVEVNGKPTKMIFDTGNTASACSFMSEAEAQSAGVTIPPDAKLTTHIGVNGSGSCKEFTIRRLKLGPIDRSDVTISVNLDTGKSAGLEAPLLGQPFWEGYEYTIDRKSKMIHFVRR